MVLSSKSKTFKRGKVAEIGFDSFLGAGNWILRIAGQGTSEWKAFVVLHLKYGNCIMCFVFHLPTWSRPATAFLNTSPSIRRPVYRQPFPPTREPGHDA